MNPGFPSSSYAFNFGTTGKRGRTILNLGKFKRNYLVVFNLPKRLEIPRSVDEADNIYLSLSYLINHSITSNKYLPNVWII